MTSARHPTIIKILTVTVMMALMSTSCMADVVITAVGDIMMGGRLSPILARNGYDYPFRFIGDELRQGDVTIGNLEAPFSSRGREFTGKSYRFRVPPRGAAALQQAGFDIVTLANNHILDYGHAALSDTMTLLRQHSIHSVGAGATLEEARRPAIVTIRGKRLAFLAYSLTQPVEFFAARSQPGTAPALPLLFSSDIRAAKRNADYVIVSFHWGKEGASQPTTIQRDYARCAIDAGADVVIGHHPHVLQGAEYYRQGLILYSLGNFVFGSNSRTADISMIARITLGDGPPSLLMLPIDTRYDRVHFQPRAISADRRSAVDSRIARLSEILGGKTDSTVGGIRLQAPVKRLQVAKQP